MKTPHLMSKSFSGEMNQILCFQTTPSAPSISSQPEAPDVSSDASQQPAQSTACWATAVTATAVSRWITTQQTTAAIHNQYFEAAKDAHQI